MCSISAIRIIKEKVLQVALIETSDRSVDDSIRSVQIENARTNENRAVSATSNNTGVLIVVS
jgi:hypothetical protein